MRTSRAGYGRISFNGATAMKPWKRHKMPRGWACVPWLQWGHGDEAVEEDPRRTREMGNTQCFNGATAMKPWKRMTARDTFRARLRASMGPRR